MSGVRYVEVVWPWRATDLVAEVYREIQREFGLLADPRNGRSPYLAHSPAPDLLAAAWSMHYEISLVGAISRADKEALAAAVSASNACRYCEDAHAMLAQTASAEQSGGTRQHATLPQTAEDWQQRLVAWGRASRSPDDPLLAQPPFTPTQAPEIIGTALVFHYINRVVEVFLGPEGILPTTAGLRPLMHAAMGLLSRRAMRRARLPGQSLHLIPHADAPAGLDLDWAAPSPHIAAAVRGMAATVEHAAAPVISPPIRERTAAVLRAWRGEEPGLSRGWLDAELTGLDARAVPVVRIALLTALAPRRLNAQDVSDFRSVHPADRDLVVTVAWSAFHAAARIGEWLIRPEETS